jgi:hypothetical protein
MSESTAEQVEQVDPEAMNQSASASPPDASGRVEHAASSVKHAVENAVEKVADALHVHKDDAAEDKQAK